MIAKETDLLSRDLDELEYEFKFGIEVYAYQAIVLSKLDKNLQQAYARLVPDMVSEEDFWRNYFYEIERFLDALGQPSRATVKLAPGEA